MSARDDQPVSESVRAALSHCWVDKTGAALRFTYADQVTPEPERDTKGASPIPPKAYLGMAWRNVSFVVTSELARAAESALDETPSQAERRIAAAVVDRLTYIYMLARSAS